jgi:putative ABC transport system permease protein
MIKNYLTIAFRTFSRNKYHFTLNLTGLVLGISCFTSLALFIYNELTYDKFYKDSENIYRITTYIKRNERELKWAVTTGGLVSTLKEKISGVKDAAKLLLVQREFDFVIDDKLFAIPERTGFFSDKNIFNIFNFKILAGDSSMLAEPNSIVLTKNFAEKLFGTTDVLGRTIISKEIERDSVFKVTGLLENPQPNSHIQFDFLLSGPTDPSWKKYDDKKDGGGVYVYFKTFPGINEDNLISAIKQEVKNDYIKLLPRREYPIQKLTDIYFNANNLYEHTKKGNINFIKILSVVALFIITISIISYVLLSTSQSLQRAREIGVRKVLGSSRKKLFTQFLTEAVVISCLAGFIAILIIELILRFAFPLWFDIQLSLWNNPLNIALLFLLSIIIGILAGLFPAFKITTFNTIQTLKGKAQHQNGISIRAILITSQFVFTIAIIAGSIIVLRQLSYLKNIDTGLDKDMVINIRKPEIVTSGAWQDFKKVIKNESLVKDAGTTAWNFISFKSDYNTNFIQVLGTENDTTVLNSQYNMIDYNTIPTLGIDVIEGRNFSADFHTDSLAIILNKAAKKALGDRNLVGLDAITGFRKKGKIIGIINDYHFQTFDKEIAPVILLFDYRGWEQHLLVKFAASDYQSALKTVEKRWKEIGIESPFQYSFLDDSFAKLTKRETQIGRMISIFTIISMAITVLSLLGLISYIIEQRKKEIGIRKALGASVKDIIIMVNQKYTLYVLIAFIIAVPLSLYGIEKWLQNFAYRITITSWDYVVTAIIVFAVAILTISLQSLRVAVTNPVETLKEE